MKRSLVGGLFAAIIALLLIWFFWLRDRGDKAPVAADGSARSAKVEPAKPVADQPKDEPSRASMQAPRWMMDVDKVGPLTLEGQVIDAEGKGVAKAEVWLGSVPPRTTVTEDDGSFSFDKLVGRTYALSAKTGALMGGPITHKLTAKSDPVVIKLAEAAAIQVTVVDPDKKPVAGAAVKTGDSIETTATTDAKGEAKLAPVAPGYARVDVSAEGYAAAGTFTTVGSPGSTARLTVTLARGFAISGRVIDESGQPVAKAKVSVAGGFDWRFGTGQRTDPNAATTDDRGQFKIAAVAAGSHVLVAVDGEHAPARTKPITVDGRPVTGVEIVMKVGGVLAGVVVDTADKPVPFATVRMAGAGAQMMMVPARQATADETGAFELRGVARTKMQVRAESENAASKILDFDLSDKTEQRDVRLVLDVTGMISGIVVDDKGQPVAEAPVNAFPDILAGGTTDNIALSGMSSATTDGAGAFKVTGLPDGAYKLWAQRPNGNLGGWGVQNVSASTGDKNVKITLASPGGIKGAIVQDGGGPPKVATAAVGWSAPTPAQDGKFEIKELDPGTYDVTIRGPEFAVMIKRDIKVEPGKVVDLGTITVFRGRKVTGRVVDGKGKPVGGAKVRLGDMIVFPDEPQPAAGDGDDDDTNDLQAGQRQATSDAEGYFSIIGVAARSTSIAADHPTAGRSAALTIPDGKDDPPPLTLALRGFGSISGKVTQKGKPLAGVAITQSAKGAGAQLSAAQTDDDGTFTMKKVPEGTVTVQAMQQKMMAMKSTSKTVQVTAGQETKVVIDIPVGQVTLTVNIKPSSGATVDAAQVFLFAGNVNPPNGKALTDAFLGGGAQGMKFWFGAGKPPASFDELVPGDYSVCSIPITGNMNDPQFSMRLQENVASLKVYCKQLKVGASPVQQTVAQELPSMTPLPAPN